MSYKNSYFNRILLITTIMLRSLSIILCMLVVFLRAEDNSPVLNKYEELKLAQAKDEEEETKKVVRRRRRRTPQTPNLNPDSLRKANLLVRCCVF